MRTIDILGEACDRYFDPRQSIAFVKGATWVNEKLTQRIKAMEEENKRLSALLREVKPLKEAP